VFESLNGAALVLCCTCMDFLTLAIRSAEDSLVEFK
jgi:hypothetical protein